MVVTRESEPATMYDQEEGNVKDVTNLHLPQGGVHAVVHRGYWGRARRPLNQQTNAVYKPA